MFDIFYKTLLKIATLYP